MSRDDLMALANKAGVLDDQHYGSRWADRLVDFAYQVAAVEREACAALVEAGVGQAKTAYAPSTEGDVERNFILDVVQIHADYFASAIRARS